MSYCYTSLIHIPWIPPLQALINMAKQSKEKVAKVFRILEQRLKSTREKEKFYKQQAAGEGQDKQQAAGEGEEIVSLGLVH